MCNKILQLQNVQGCRDSFENVYDNLFRIDWEISEKHAILVAQI